MGDVVFFRGGFAAVVGCICVVAPAFAQAAMTASEQQSFDAARKDLAVAQTKQKLAEQAEQAAQGEKAEADNAKLLKLGISVGLSAGLEFPIGSTEGTSLQTPAFVAMPYVILLPAYWWDTEAGREYCASAWGGGSEDSATKAAMAIARRKAEREFEVITSALKANVPATDLQNRMSKNAAFASLVVQIKAWVDDTSWTADERQLKKNDLVAWLAEQDWNSSLRGSCWGKRLGFFFGRPIDHPVRVQLSGGAVETRDFVPYVSFGGTFTPNAYVSLLVGVTVGAVQQQGPEGTVRDPRTAWAGTISLGGNFDLASALIKGVAAP